MARIQLIIPLFLWALWRDGGSDGSSPLGPWVGTAAYVCGLMILVTFVRLSARRAMRRTTIDRPAPVPRFHRTVSFARWLILGWHATALWELGYGDALRQAFGPAGESFRSLPAFTSVLPVVAAWVGLIRAQYPLDRGVREQNALYDVEFGQPVRPVPTLSHYTSHAVRSQILFTLTPLLAIAFAHDALSAGGTSLGWPRDRVEWVATLAAVGFVFAFVPELLRHVLPTQPLPPSPLRDRLDALSRRLRLGVRDILLWRTHHSIGNAAVMGLVPGVRYVLITDLLLETMPPDEIEAVFAHEAGHVKHRHIAWYLVFWLSIGVGLQMLTTPAIAWAVDQGWAEPTADAVTSTLSLLIAFMAFGALSRAFERQADAFAARRLTEADGDTPGRDGAAIFASALRHVARVNNLPLDSRSYTAGRPWVGRVIGRVAHHAATWLHGSIRSRIDHLAKLAGHPAAARRFDRAMLGLRGVLLLALVAAAWAIVHAGAAF